MNKINTDLEKNYHFLARSFARMQASGHPVSLDSITGNMSEEQNEWFRKAYRRYLAQALNTRKLEL